MAMSLAPIPQEWPYSMGSGGIGSFTDEPAVRAYAQTAHPRNAIKNRIRFTVFMVVSARWGYRRSRRPLDPLLELDPEELEEDEGLDEDPCELDPEEPE